ncbi:fungal hydrophobin [Peniophora sp. CONT]|nr:fungal hydrophobin [Peniophora sp. CONT]
MFSRIAVIVALAATAVMARPQIAGPVSSCNNGDLQCCNSVQSAKTVDFESMIGSSVESLFPDFQSGTNAPVGLTCSPLIADTSGAAQCNQQSVCCNGGHFSGLFSLNCIPFNGGTQSTGIF